MVDGNKRIWENKEVQKRIKEIAVWGFLVSAFVVLVIVNILWGRHIIDSDYATQLLLSKICSEEKRILTNSWIYGNEIRFINTQIVYGGVFLFTDDWSKVRTIGNAILYLLMLGTYFYMMRSVKIEKKYKLIGGGLILIPYSIVALSIIYMSADYLPPVCIMLLALGAFMESLGAVEGKNRGMAIKSMAVLCAIFLIAGMNGIRSVLVILGPLCLVGIYRLILNTDKKVENEMLIWIVSIISFVTGFGINVFVFMPKYGFNSHNGLAFADLGDGILLKNMEECLSMFLKALGYAPASVFSLHGIIDMAVLCLAVSAVYMVGNNMNCETEGVSEGLLKQFLVCSVLFNLVFYGITDGRMLIPRYVIHVNSILIPVLIICVYQERDKIKKYVYILVISCFFGIGALRTYYSLAINDYNADRYASIRFLQENHLEFGYATPWNAGVIMELTDGEIEVVNMEDFEHGIPDGVTCPRRWFTESYKDPVFLLLSAEEFDSCQGSDILSIGDLAYEDENFKILIYQSAGDICKYSLGD